MKAILVVGPDTDFYTWQAFCCPDCKPDFVKNPRKYTSAK